MIATSGNTEGECNKNIQVGRNSESRVQRKDAGRTLQKCDTSDHTTQKGPHTEDAEQEIAKFQQLEWKHTELGGVAIKFRTGKMGNKELKYIYVSMMEKDTVKVPGTSSSKREPVRRSGLETLETL
eukprot:13451565-Heterocapsa_arctica.AAC.1